MEEGAVKTSKHFLLTFGVPEDRAEIDFGRLNESALSIFEELMIYYIEMLGTTWNLNL